MRPQSWDYTGEIYGLERPSGAHRADLGGADGYPSGGSSPSSSSGSVYRGRRRQQEDAVADDRPYGRRSARTRWQQGEEDSTGTFSRYQEPDDRAGRHASGWSPAVAPTSGWTPAAAPTSGWVGASSTSEWTREAYTGEWTRGDFTGEWHRDTGEPMTPSRSDSGRRAEPGGRRRAAPDWLELPDDADYDSRPVERPAVPPQRDSFTDTSEWIAPRGEPAGEGQVSRPRRPDWAVGLDSSATGRRRRSWQDQTEARWPSSDTESGRAADSRADEPVGSWSSSRADEPVGTWSSSRAEEPATRWSGVPRQRSDARLAEDDPRWVGIPSSAPRSPAVAFPDEPDFDYDDRPSAPSAPTTYRDDPPPTYRATATPRARAEAPVRPPAADWRAPAAAPGGERAVVDAPTRVTAPDWRAPAAPASSERAVAEVPTRAVASDWRAPAADTGRERALGAAVRRVATPDELDDEYTRAPGGVLAAVVATLAWYAVPLLLFGIYTLTQGVEAQALGSLSGGLTRFGAALVVSLVVAVLLRWVSSTWRSISVGLAAAVVGGGLSTVLLSAISGQPLGG